MNYALPKLFHIRSVLRNNMMPMETLTCLTVCRLESVRRFKPYFIAELCSRTSL
jgi:hypothetical protein